MIRVSPVNEAGLVCDVLVRVLDDEDDLQTIGPATSADAALALAQEADVVLVGTQLPEADALELTGRLTDGVPGAKVVMGQEIADWLSLTEGTVNNHVHSILRKLDVRSRQDGTAHVALVR